MMMPPVWWSPTVAPGRQVKLGSSASATLTWKVPEPLRYWRMCPRKSAGSAPAGTISVKSSLGLTPAATARAQRFTGGGDHAHGASVFHQHLAHARVEADLNAARGGGAGHGLGDGAH